MGSLKTRNIGLDILRSIAVLSVMFHHSAFLLSVIKEQPLFIKLIINIGSFGNLGVDLFFSLSGFLIGGIIIKLVEKNQFNQLKQLNHFWMRRWLRTLPNYYLILLLYFLSSASFMDSIQTNWQYLIFTQNLFHDLPGFFSSSWSLSVEEWFYLSFPIFILAISKIFRNASGRKKILWSILSFIVLFSIIREFVQPEQINNLFEGYKRIVLFRVDSIAYGVLAAYLHYYHSETFFKYKNISLLISLILLLTVLYTTYLNVIKHESALIYLFNRHLQVIASCIGFTGLIPYFYSIEIKSKALTQVILNISILSYSLYLINMPIYVYVNRIAIPVELRYLLFWLISFCLAWLIYRFYEKPIMNMRDKVFQE